MEQRHWWHRRPAVAVAALVLAAAVAAGTTYTASLHAGGTITAQKVRDAAPD